MEYPNFYENLAEANRRLHNSVVLYDGEPYRVAAIADHNPDGIFRVYLCPLSEARNVNTHLPTLTQVPRDHPEFGSRLDADILRLHNPSYPIIRKTMNSPHFRRFRPFPLGMVNKGAGVIYTEWTPARRSEQGLMESNLRAASLTPTVCDSHIQMYTPTFRNTIVGDYPSAGECLAAMLDDNVENEGVAFHRLFAFTRGPAGLVVLNHKEEAVGYLPSGDLSVVRLGKKFGHLREAVMDLSLFASVHTV